MADLGEMKVKVSADIQDLQKKMDAAGGSVAKLGDKFKPMIKGSGEASAALINLGRVAQDIPYGFQGIANNLNPLLESFQRLKAETGSSSKALKALGSSLIGAGGLGFALSLASSAFLIFQNGFQSFSRKAGGVKKSIDEIKEALDQYVKTLDDVTAANLKGSQSAQEQLVSLKTLYEATQNANIPLADRKKLVDELQEQYPKYFKNISDETILAGGATDAYNKLSTAILNAARARAAQESLVEIQKQILTLEQQQIDNANEQLSAYKAIGRAKSAALAGGAQQGQGILFYTNQMGKAEETLNEKIKVGNNIQAQKNNLLNRALSLTRDITKTVEQDPSSLLNLKGKEINVKPDKIKVEKPKKLEFERGIIEEFTTKPLHFDNVTEPLAGTLPTDDIVRSIDPAILAYQKLIYEMVQAQLEADRLAAIVDAANQNMADSLKGTLIVGMQNLGEALGGALADGGNIGEAIFGSLFETLSQGLIELGKAMVALGTAKVAIEKFNFAPGAGTVIAGIATIALGTLLKSSIPKFAGGVENFRGGFALVGERGPEIVNLPSGSDVIPNHRLNNIGGQGQSIEVFGRIEAHGDKLITIFDRAQKRMSRAG